MKRADKKENTAVHFLSYELFLSQGLIGIYEIVLKYYLKTMSSIIITI